MSDSKDKSPSPVQHDVDQKTDGAQQVTQIGVQYQGPQREGPSTAIIVALIGLAGTVITALAVVVAALVGNNATLPAPTPTSAPGETATLTYTPTATETAISTPTDTSTFIPTATNTLTPIETPTLTSFPTSTILPTVTPISNTPTPTPFSCGGRVISGGATAYNVMHSEPGNDSSARSPVRAGTIVIVRGIARDAQGNVWYHIFEVNTELGWIPATYLVPSPLCPSF